MSPRWLVGVLIAGLLLNVVSAIFELASTPITDLNKSDYQVMMQSNVTEATDDAGGIATWWSTGTAVFSVLGKTLTADYSFWYIDDGAGGREASDWHYFRYILICINIVMLIFLALLFRQIFSPA